jgi:hypothetical protein
LAWVTLRVGAGLLMPDIKPDRPDGAICVGCQEMAAWMEVAMDECMGGEKGLSLLWQLELLHLPFSAPCRSMRVLRAVVQISALSMLDIRKQLTHADGRIRLAPFGKGVFRVLRESEYIVPLIGKVGQSTSD